MKSSKDRNTECRDEWSRYRFVNILSDMTSIHDIMTVYMIYQSDRLEMSKCMDMNIEDIECIYMTKYASIYIIDMI
jgi:hypothetical protein